MMRPGFQGTAPATLTSSWSTEVETKKKLKKIKTKKNKKNKKKDEKNTYVFIGSRLGNSLLVGLSTKEMKQGSKQKEDSLKRNHSSSSSSSAPKDSISTSSNNKRGRVEVDDDDDDDDAGLYDDEDADLYGSGGSAPKKTITSKAF